MFIGLRTMPFFAWLAPLKLNQYALQGLWPMTPSDPWFVTNVFNGIQKSLPPPVDARAFWASELGRNSRVNGLAAVVWDEVDSMTYAFAENLASPNRTEQLLAGFADTCTELRLPMRVDMHHPSDLMESVKFASWTVSRCGPDAVPWVTNVAPQIGVEGEQRGNGTSRKLF